MSVQQRTLLLLLVCLPVRALVAYAAKHTSRTHLPKLALLALVPAVGLTYNYVRAKRVGAFGGPAWWQPMRIVHATVFLLFAVLAAQRHPGAWVLLALDVVLAALAFVLMVAVKAHGAV